nr:water channel protein AQP h3 [Hymenolepis microstoma]
MPKGKALVWKFFQIFVCECVGAGIVCFPAFLMPPSTVTPDIASPLVCGCAVYLGLWIVGATSGGQMNPVVTLAAAITRRTPILYVPIYLVAQLCGSLVSMTVAYRLNNSLSRLPNTYGLTLPSADTPVGTAVGMEIVITMILVLTWLASLDEIRDVVWQIKTCNNFPISMLIAIAFGAAVGQADVMSLVVSGEGYRCIEHASNGNDAFSYESSTNEAFLKEERTVLIGLNG